VHSTGAFFRSKAGARLVESVARGSSNLTIEEVVAFLSNVSGAVRARPSGACRRSEEFDFRITISQACRVCGESRLKLF
jgi:hypothetical protein